MVMSSVDQGAAAVIKGLGDVFHGIWQATPAWDFLIVAALLLAIWDVARRAIGPSSRVATQASGRCGDGFCWLILGVITFVGFCLRIYAPQALPYWWDELLAVWLGQAPIATMLRSLFTPEAAASDFTPPLFYTLLHAWISLFGETESSTRTFTALLSTVSIPLLCLVGRRLFSWPVGLTASFLLSFSPPAIFYAQQIRCYALLGALALTVVYFANKITVKFKTTEAFWLAFGGTAFLYTHYVASWLWLGMAMAVSVTVFGAQAQQILAGSLVDNSRSRLGPWFVAAAALGLAALCPFFHPPSLDALDALTPVVVVAAATIMILVGVAVPGGQPPGRRALIGTVLAFVLPALLLSLWMLPSGVIHVVGGAGTRIPGSYGFPEFAKLLAEFAGPQAYLDKSAQGLGVFTLLSGLFFASSLYPSSAVLLLGWVGFPMALAMAVQNPSMNLVRYLIATLPGVLLLMGLALCESWQAITNLLAWLGRKRFVDWSVRLRLPVLVPLFLVAAIFGYRSYCSIQFPTVRANFENYAAVASRINEQDSFFLIGESHNLVRAVSWYLARLGRASVLIHKESPRINMANVFLDGRFWHKQASAVLDLDNCPAIPGNYGEIALSSSGPYVPQAVTGRSADHGGEQFALGVDAFRRGVAGGANMALTYDQEGGLVPLFKKQPGEVWMRLETKGGAACRGLLDASVIVAGPDSRVQIAVKEPGNVAPLAQIEFRQKGIKRVLVGEADPSSGGVLFNIPPLTDKGALELHVVIADDNSGVIYSSNAVLRSMSLRIEPL